MRYLLDTNVVIDIIHKDKAANKRYQLELLKRSKIFICPIVYYEVVRGFSIVSRVEGLNFVNWRAS